MWCRADVLFAFSVAAAFERLQTADEDGVGALPLGLVDQLQVLLQVDTVHEARREGQAEGQAVGRLVVTEMGRWWMSCGTVRRRSDESVLQRMGDANMSLCVGYVWMSAFTVRMLTLAEQQQQLK